MPGDIHRAFLLLLKLEAYFSHCEKEHDTDHDHGYHQHKSDQKSLHGGHAKELPGALGRVR
jgi:hypothetical protein